MSAQPTAYGRHRLALRQAGGAVRALLAVASLTVLVAGLPYGLAHFIGWPLPHDVPTREDVTVVLTTPMSTSFLADVLACVLWPCWALFVLDVARAAVGAARGLPVSVLPTAGPLPSLAAALVGTLVLSLLVLRPAASVSAAPAPTRAAATAPAKPGITPVTIADRRGVSGTVEVRAPRDGFYDSLWRIADRELGDGSRWPEIYALNRGRPQADGRTLTSPHLIRPGWILRLPTTSALPPRTPTRPPVTAAPSPPSRPSPPPSPTRAGTPAPHESRHDSHGPGIALPSGGFVGAALAAIAAGALATVLLRRRIHYEPGSGDRDDLAVAPVVRALRIAHDRAASDSAPALRPGAPMATHTVGVRDGQALAWDLAGTRGLGLIGPGTIDAARALLVSLLAEQDAGIVTPRAGAELLLDGAASAGVPGLQLVEDLDAALALLESELLSRTRMAADGGDTSASRKLVLVAAPNTTTHRRLQAVLDNGSSLNLAGVLLGQWLPGGTLRVRADGTVTATSPDLAATFTGARLFHLPAADARDLLDLLIRAAPPTSPQPPALAAVTAPRPSNGHRPAPSYPAPPEARRPRRKLGTGSPSDAAPQQAPIVSGPSPEAPDEGEPTPAAEEPEPDDARLPLELTFLGRVRLTHHLPDGDTHADLTSSLTPKHRELLTYLALHPDGVRREALGAAIWPDAPRTRPYNSFHATLSQLRSALRTATHDEQTDVTLNTDGVYALDPHRASVDLWALNDALRAARIDAPARRPAVEQALTLYTGDLATDVVAEWIEAPREALRRDLLDALSALIRDVRPMHPDEALRLLERARSLDPYNEAVYRAIARLQTRLGHHDAVPRTESLLATVLAEIDERPSAETSTLFTELRARQNRKPAPPTSAVGS
ncbi:hypothetical protein [Streptomyces sp. NPDC021224]|uniref:hypothetical protein n=1 Tax=unclassified Streptomyces TaxID=2593676 RepID=UPI0037ACEEB2